MKEVRLIDVRLAQHIANNELSKEEAGIVQWVLSHTPSTSPESLRPHGKWVVREDDLHSLYTIQCSMCGEEWCFEESGDAVAMHYHYCPNCGANMDLED